MVHLPSSTVVGRCCVALLAGLAACGWFESDEAQDVARATQETVSRGVDSAKEQLDKVDTEKIGRTWDGMVEAVEDSTKSDPSGSGSTDPLAGAAKAITCDAARERCTVTAEFAARAREHGTKVAGQVRVTRVAGTVNGVRIDAIDAGTIAALVGLKVGDVVTHVNGTALGSAQDVMMLYMSVRSAQSFAIDYQRGGEARSLQVDVV
jgi:type II secretory pathway component PulC